jgi:hypothetical protein
MRSDQHHRLPCPFLHRRVRFLHRTALLPNRRPCQRTTRQTKNQPNSQQFHLSSRTTALFLRAETNSSRPILLSNLTVRRFASWNSILIWRASAAKCLQPSATRRIYFTDFLNGQLPSNLRWISREFGRVEARSGRVPWSRARAAADTNEWHEGDCIGKLPSPGADSIFHRSESKDGSASAGISPSSAHCSETSSG